MYGLLLSTLFSLSIPLVLSLLEGPNVCTRQETYSLTVRVSEEQPYQVREYVWCLNFPPRCSKYKIKFKTVYKTQNLVKTRPVEDCCKGYTKNNSEDRCIPVCSNDCIHGTCTAPDTCHCETGYGGPYCDISCPKGLWGRECQNHCECENNSTCDPFNGSCHCVRGWIGKKCEHKCGKGQYGQDCLEKCRCENGYCDHVSGECRCYSGYMGPLCEDPCPMGKHGSECKSECRCQNNGTCDPETGYCFCKDGWTGIVCANRCPFGFWGDNCSQPCDCYNGASCNHINGSCECQPGFTGVRCLDVCSEGTFGVNCQEKCVCKNGAKCSNKDGSCICGKGWEGKLCDKRTCPDDFWGAKCNSPCQCNKENTEMCHPWTGECECKAGWNSQDCSRPCPILTFGKGCRGFCNCQNNAQCSPLNGTCFCPPGFTGSHCENNCPEGTFGEDCAQRCDCKNGASCSSETGQCQCPAGWEGQQCDRPCSNNSFGEHCNQKCVCRNGASCNPVNGSCTCGAGYTGEYCENKCEQGYFGVNCEQICQCLEGHHFGCDPVTGKCICKPEWKGVMCESNCPPGKFGLKCDQICDCMNNSSCDPESGKCYCTRGWHGEDCSIPCKKGFYGIRCKQRCPEVSLGNKTCDHITGEYICPPGYLGLTCEHPCPIGKSGKNCHHTCSCKNGGDCHHVTGECQCLPGWIGSNCTVPCPSGSFGMNCSQHCKCLNGGECRRNDGICRCKPGYTGTQCTEICPEGYYGDHCMTPCECKNDNFLCHPAEGCTCRHGFSGEDCQQSNILSRTHEVVNRQGNFGVIIAVIMVSIIFLTVVLLLIFYYRRRVANLKTEIAHVQYIADPSGFSPDRNHFDNPVYSYQSGTKRDNEQLLNNSAKIHNNLHKPLNTNLEKARLGFSTATEDEDLAKGIYDSSVDELKSLKNREADSTNPNIYHSIEKVDHVYDEIKQKDKDIEGMLIRIQATVLVAILVTIKGGITEDSSSQLFVCPLGWELRGLHCYKFFNIKHSWEKAAELCRRYGSDLVVVENFSENNFTAILAAATVPLDRQDVTHYWLGLASLDDLRTNTLESAAGTLVSQYSGFWSINQPNPTSGECVDVVITEDIQSWELTTCESLLPFMCRSKACPTGTFHCSNGKCVNEKFRCDKEDDCGDESDELDCSTNCHFYLASSGDVIESPYYPHKYAPLTNCKWTLEGPQGHNILLQFQEFETERTYDTVQILVGGRTEDTSVNLATLSGKQDLTNKSFISASNFMIIKFSTDGSVERKGFRASWKTEPQICGGMLNASPQDQVLTSPGYPEHYPGGLECLYIITAQSGRIITLEVDDLDLENDRDYVLIRDGNSPKSEPLARLSGYFENNQKLIMSTKSQLYIYFKTSLGDSQRGFRLRYTQGCKATIVAHNGTLVSPAFGLNNYPNNQECLLKLKNPSGGPLSLNFNIFDVHKSDFLQVYDGSTKSGLRLHPGNGFTATSKPKITLTASSGEMLVRFLTDALHNSQGWEAVFSADCPSLQPGTGALASSRDTTFRTVITFSCPTGQEFATGRNRITTQCMPGGNWSINYIPKCQEVYCGPVPQIDNGFSIGSTNVTYRGQAMYQCYAGFAFPTGQPIERISCLSDGHWEKKPNCLASQCAVLPEVPHANITILNGLGRSYGTIVRYECEPGYIRSGPPVILCMSNGTWSGPVPVCTRAKCSSIPEIKNGFITDMTRKYYYNDEVRFQCFKGYKLIGNNIIKCGANKLFNNPPKCEDINECINSQCDLASTECINGQGSFYCKCRKGFEPTHECRPVGDLGLVNGGIPDESISVSSSEPGYDRTMVRLNSGLGWCGNTIEGGSNWVLIDLRAPTIIRGFRTMAVSRPDGNLAFTSAVRIQYTDNLTDVFKDYRNPDGLAVEFTIEKPSLSILNLPVPIEARYIKFKIQDYFGAPCMKLEIMGCTRLECTDINECSDNNGGCQQKCINSAGGYTCSCNVGFELYTQNGTSSYYIEKSETGLRDGDIYQVNKSCVPVLCPSINAPENGLILSTKEKYHFGDLIKFQCNFGYIMSGSPSLLCTSNGIWNGTVPECQYAQCVSLPDDKNEGLKILRNDEDSILVPFRDNVTLHCGLTGRYLKGTATAGFRQCVYNPKPGLPDYWLSGKMPSCPRIDCGKPPTTAGAEYGQYIDTKYQSSFFFGCQNTFKLAGQSSKHDNVVRCQANGVWDFGDLRCEGPVCGDPGRPSDGFQIARSYEQGSEVSFGCSRPGFILINPRPITCIREPECKVVRPLGLASGKIPDSAINATSERPNYEAKNIRLNSVTGWCGKQEAFTYVSVDLGKVYRIKAILVKGVVTNDIVGRPTEIRFFYKQADNENYVVYFPNFNLTMRDPGNYGELAMISLPKYVQARFVILGIVSYMDNACLKFELMGCDEPEKDPLLGYDYGLSPCVDNETPIFQNCPQQPIIVQKDINGGLLPINFTEPIAVDNSGSIARLEKKPASFKTPMYIFQDTVVKYVAYDYDGNVAICEINITVPDNTPPQLSCPQSYVIELVDRQDSYFINFNETRRKLNTSDSSGEVHITFIPDKATVSIGTFENITVVATDKYGNKASCHFQVAVQATPCVDWELKPPNNGALNCLQGEKGLQCIGTCNPGYRFTDGELVKTFSCNSTTQWKPTSVVPDCVSENTQQADYHLTASLNYRANGAVAKSCLNQYTDLISQDYVHLNKILSERCSAVNVDMNVSFIKAVPSLIDENVVKIDYILDIIPIVQQPQLYDLCGSTLSLIFDLSVPYASAVIEPLSNISSIGNQCPPLKALKSTNFRGFTCNIGEVLNMDTNDVPRCLHCPAGTFAGENQTECSYCPRGFYQNRDRQGSCVKCPQGTYTKEEGSKNLHECVPVCGYGTYSPTGLVPCLECPRNSYTDEPPTGGCKDCQACPTNTFTYQPSARNKNQCKPKCNPGFYSSTGLAPCSLCPKDFYQSLTGQTVCNECPGNMITEGPGATGRDECHPVQCKDNSCQHGGLCVPMGHGIHCFCPAGFSGRRCEIDIDECTSQPCYNGATCVDLPQGYKCHCAPGYSGINCQEERTDCKNDTCPARAMCKDEPGYKNYTCLCRSGYTGIDCDVTIDPCLANGNPCHNGATCVALQQGRFMCECLPGWEGQLCETNINDCEENPCLLQSNCTDMVADFSCSCPSGFTGKRCQEKIDLCAPNPCKNGICVDKLFYHQCICHPGWTGNSCESNINDCSTNPCENGGHCLDEVNGYTCTCEPGFTGKKCQHTIDYCSSEPCQNGATCTDLVDGFSCKCRPGFVGLQCEAEVDECLSDPCNALGTDQCVNQDNEFICMCREGYTGPLCEVDVDDCQSEPCLNGGSCRDEVDTYYCICRPGWTGRNCEIDVGSCQSRPCQNDAECINLFQDYFCVCPSGTDGKQCETAPERCIGNPCMHGGKCQDYGSGLNCSCSDGFSGIGCQYEYDACTASACKNGATCINDIYGFKCMCSPGYTGKYCDEDIIDCKENSCPPSATCIDLTENFYCQCPFNLTGEDCRKTISVDYDLFFTDATRSSSSQIIPFYTGSKSSLTIAMWVQFTQKDENGIFFTLYGVSSKHVPSDRRPIIQAHSSGVLVSIFQDLQDIYLSYRDYTTINDAQWHHIAIVWDGENGGELKLITEGLIASKVDGYASGRQLPNYAWVTLGKPQSGNLKAYTESGFQGHLTKVQVWGRALDVTNEIQKQVRDCRSEPVLYRGLLLTWAGYEDTVGGVERIVPSQCGQRNCQFGYKGSKCQELVLDKIPPRVEYCPGDLWIITKNGSALVVWDEPHFNDNVGVVSVQEKNGHRPGQTLLWGVYQIAYVASDEMGNSATCTFKVSILSDFCPELNDPVGGLQICKDWGAGGQFKVCEIKCNQGLRFSQDIPQFYTCGSEGFWRPTKNPSLPLIYPACSVSKPAQRVFKISMLFPSSVLCNEAGQGVLKQKVRTAINSLNRDWNFCSYSVEGTRECKELNVDVKCDQRTKRQINPFTNEDGVTYVINATLPIEKNTRQGRQSSSGTYNIEISFPAVNDPVLHSNTNERSSIKYLLEKLILEEDQFDVRDILPNTVPDPSSLILESDYACPVGQVVMAPDCVPCAIGTFYNNETKTCSPCSQGFYQSESGQTQCKQCPQISGRPAVTIALGARSAADCKERCPAGKFYDHEAGLCRSCGHGFYQSKEGSFSCEICGLGKTTRTSEAVSVQECRDECNNGMHLAFDGKCEPCPRGTYRTQGIHSACHPCPVGRTTQKSGSITVEECSLPLCYPGSYLNGTLNSCVPCKKGYYQPESQQTTCLACPPNKSTKKTAATSKSDCTNPCEINGSEMQCDINAYCLLIPETSEFKCECKPGFNGTGKECIDVCDGYCDNEGTCVKDIRGQPSCRCIGSFTGKHCTEKSEFAYIAGGIAASVILIIFIVLLIWMICARANRRKEPKKLLTPATDQNGSQVNFYYGAPTPYAESIAPSHHSTYAHYYDDEEDGWEMPNFYNETYMKESLHNGLNGKMNSLARSNASIYGTKDDLYDRLKRHAYPGKKDKSDSDSEEQ